MKILVLSLLFLVGCEDPPKPKPVEHVVVGYVRNVWCNEICSISFETEDSKLISIEVGSMPPVWTGLHCEIRYHDKDYMYGPPNTIDYVERKK